MDTTLPNKEIDVFFISKPEKKKMLNNHSKNVYYISHYYLAIQLLF